MKAAVGGRLKTLLSGGAPLAEDAQAYIRQVLTCVVVQGYGLTETSSTACISWPDDLSVGHVGPPLNGVEIRLVDWEEGGYCVTDEVGPRGEIVVGGDHVSSGYFLMPDKTEEDFFEENGTMFFRTGDIGQLLPTGCIKIVDRKKDLVRGVLSSIFLLSLLRFQTSISSTHSPAQAPGRRVHLLGQGGGQPQDLPASGEHLRVRGLQ